MPSGRFSLYDTYTAPDESRGEAVRYTRAYWEEADSETLVHRTQYP